MRALSSIAAFFITLMGCAGATIPTTSPHEVTSRVIATPAVADVASWSDEPGESGRPSTMNEGRASSIPFADALPAAPWAAASIEAHEVPASLMRAWRRSDNRDWCAPMAPVQLGRGQGARPRALGQNGGWVLEYDRRGEPGLRPDGRLCRRCGRAAFGVAGTPMSPAQVAEGPLSEGPEPTYDDGSYAAIEVGDRGTAAATITVPGQGCVYQVWSLLGEGHVRELLDALRLVQVQDGLAMSMFL